MRYYDPDIPNVKHSFFVGDKREQRRAKAELKKRARRMQRRRNKRRLRDGDDPNWLGDRFEIG